MSSNYVREASISASASQVEIGTMLASAGATGFRCTCEDGRAAIAFMWGSHGFRIILAMPREAEEPLRPRSTGDAPKAAQEVARRRWRQLAQLIRAKLDAVGFGIVTFDQEFMAYMLHPAPSTATGDASRAGRDASMSWQRARSSEPEPTYSSLHPLT